MIDSAFKSRSITGTDKVLGKEHTWFGSSGRDLILKTKGKVKVQWANRFIDIISDGKINVDVDDVFKAYESESNIDYTKDGLAFIIDNQTFYLIYAGNKYPLTTAAGEYVSFKVAQTTSPEDKLIALKNIGFVYANKDEVETAISNSELAVGSIVYIIEDGLLYVVSESGGLSNPYYPKSGGEITGTVIINTSETNALEIAAGKNIKIGSTYYSDSGITFGSGFKIGDNFIFTSSTLTINLITTIQEIISSYIHSSGFIKGNNGYGIYKDSKGNWVIEADKIISRKTINSVDIDGADSFYIASWCTITGFKEGYEDEDDNGLPYTVLPSLTLSEQIFEVGDIGIIPYKESFYVDEESNTYSQYVNLFEFASTANSQGTNKYTADSFQLFLDTINNYNTSIAPGTAIDPDDGSTVDITIDLTGEYLDYPNAYDDSTDDFDFETKVIVLKLALSYLKSKLDGSISVDITEVEGLQIYVNFSQDFEDGSELIGKKIFKVKGNVLRLYSRDNSSNLDYYSDLSSVNDMDEDHINTRIGDMTPFMDNIIRQSPIPNDYLDKGLYSKAAYLTGGIIRSIDGKLYLDLTIPANTHIESGILESQDGSIVIDLNNNIIRLPFDLQIVTDKGNSTSRTIVAAQAVNGNELTTLDQVNNIIYDPNYVLWMKTQLGL